ncbi:MAG TPA: alcohol dehydrogenase catalytic domain-containing protein [Streptosporangiaceae bacterium]|nr:alcohol dehydrogenase catalytic domain-containing protein [Streptosporangiaceae bacterium]
MKALLKVAAGPGHVELRDVTEPAPGPGQVVLAVSYAGICGTDLHIVADEFPSWPPVVLGHEFTGQVQAVGPGVDPGLIGSRVVCEPHAGACGSCYLCRRGCIQLCADKRSPGWGIDGAFASHLAVPARLLHLVPAGLPDRVAVLAEPMAVVLSALERAPVAPGDTVVVTGPGPVGILAALAARFAGAQEVVVIGRQGSSQLRLALAAELGFATVSDAARAQSIVLSASAGRGADVLVETTGSADAIRLGADLLRRRARIAAIGLSGRSSIEFGWDRAMYKSLDIAMSSSSAYTAWEPALYILSRCADAASKLVTEFALDRWQDAFAAVRQRSVIKAAFALAPPDAAGLAISS